MASFVHGIALLGFEDFALAQGLDPHATLAEIGLPGDAQDGVISGVQFNALLELCAQRSANPLFGLQFGLQQGAQALGNLWYAIQNAGSVGEALQALMQYLHVHSNGAQLQLERHGGYARLLYEVTDGEAHSVSQTVELAMGISAHLMQSLLQHAWKPRGLLLRHSPGAEPGTYRRLLGITPRFDSPVNAWVFDETLLDIPLSAADKRLCQLAQSHLEELARITLQELPSYVQKLLRTWLPSGQVTIEQVAEHMKLSPRSLQRYLRAENTSFQTLLDDTRQALAARYLRDSSLSLTRLAGLLGYADLSTFSRAFRRWNGISPQQWKRHQLSAPTAPRSPARPAAGPSA